MACTGLVVQDGERILVGNNEDWFNPRTKIWFIQPLNGRYGGVFFGFDDFSAQGGMNQKGLFFDGFALEPKRVKQAETRPRYKGDLIKDINHWSPARSFLPGAAPAKCRCSLFLSYLLMLIWPFPG